MTSQININGSLDPFYRYQMQAVSISQEKNFTVITNIDRISKDLNRPIKDILGFLRSKLNTIITDKNDKIKIKGEVSKDIIQKLINEYVKTFVLCRECDNPETIIEKNKLICSACGHKGIIN